MSRTDAILKRLTTLYPRFMDLDLGRERLLLDKLGRPQDRLPPVIHVAGTNAKGSTIAYLRAMLEAAGKRVHVYTSPHLVRFNERIRLAGKLVTTRRVNDALEEVERVNAGAPIPQFELTTSAAFKLFAETPADYLLLEVGLGGDFDSTNVIDHPLGTIITPVDFDHQKWLGYTIAEIASHKAGILKRGAPAVIGRQRDEGLAEIEGAAAKLRVMPFVQGRDYDGYAQNGRLVYQDDAGLLDLPPPALVGHHQFDNAALAVAAVRHFKLPVSDAQLAEGLRTVVWPARIQRLTGKLSDMLPGTSELWLDGAHNAHGAAALALSLQEMDAVRRKPLVLIMGMMNTREPKDFLEPFIPMAPRVMALTIPGEPNAHPAAYIAAAATAAGLDAKTYRSVLPALREVAQIPGARVVICGSLYLAGDILAKNGTPPD